MAESRYQIGAHLLSFEDISKRDGLRWAVGTPEGPRSSTWRAWGDKKGDVYLSVRSLGAALKISLHRDRQCQLGLTREFAEKQGIAGRRYLARWKLPEAPIVRAVSILVPEEELGVFPSKEAEPMRWIAPPAIGEATVISLFISEPPDTTAWPGPETGGAMLGILASQSRFCWLVHSNQRLDELTKENIQAGKKQALDMPLIQRLPADRAGLRMVLFGGDHDFFCAELNAEHLDLLGAKGSSSD